MKFLSSVVSFVLACAVPAVASVAVSSPASGTVGPTVQFVASSSTSTCSAGVAAMGVYVNDNLQYVVDGQNLNTSLTLNPGTYKTTVEEWDYCGGATYAIQHVTVTNDAGVAVSSPANGSTVASPTAYVATATSDCWLGVAAMGIYVDNQLVYTVSGATANTQLTMSAGAHQTVVEEWDYCGGATYTAVNITVIPSGTVLGNLQASNGWIAYGELAPLYNTCSSSCDGVDFSYQQGISSPSLSGNATQFNLGGSTPYSDALFTIPLLGDNSSQNIRDKDHHLLPTIHNYTYDADVYVTKASITQSLEFDVSMYMNGNGMIWGSQCDHLADGNWDIWDNVNAAWVSTGIACSFNNNGWNHVTLQFARKDDDTLIYNSLTMNGITYNLNASYAPFSVPTSWWGVTANYQMDGNYRQSANTTYLDNFSLTYW